jgi:hypothetical protein
MILARVRIAATGGVSLHGAMRGSVQADLR